MIYRWIKASALAFLGVCVAGQFAVADIIDNIKKSGKLVVGVKADYKPYGFLDKGGNIIGIEPDLAKDVADRLGVRLELIPVVASNRMEFLQQGKIDLMIATMTDLRERAKEVFIVQPDYYSSGTSLLSPKSIGLKDWHDLRGKPVCGIEGAFYNRKIAEKFGAEIIAFKGTAEALGALQQGRCVGFVFDDSMLNAILQEDKWKDYEMPLETIDDVPWGLAVRLGEYSFYGIMSEMIMNWHATGRILELERKYGVKNSPFAIKMHKKYSGMQ